MTLSDGFVSGCIVKDGVNKYLMELAREQIRIAFEQAQKEVSDLHQRTREGIETARLNRKQSGQRKGTTYGTQKARAAKDIICRHNRSFGGSLTDDGTMRQAGISRKAFINTNGNSAGQRQIFLIMT